jgi:hypothetical protein
MAKTTTPETADAPGQQQLVRRGQALPVNPLTVPPIPTRRRATSERATRRPRPTWRSGPAAPSRGCSRTSAVTRRTLRWETRERVRGIAQASDWDALCRGQL